MTEKLGASVTKIKLRKVNVAGKNVVMVNRIVSFEMKLGDLPKETVMTYTIPLGTGIDLIPSLPWVEKHNPRVDWRLCSFKFNRNGRRHMLWPAKMTLLYQNKMLHRDRMSYSRGIYYSHSKYLRPQKTSATVATYETFSTNPSSEVRGQATGQVNRQTPFQTSFTSTI